MGQKSPRMRVSRKRGFSLAEIGVVMGILAIILGLSIPAYVRYRSHQTVNRALEMTEGLAVRAKEEAKSSGFALSDKVRESGVPQAAISGRQQSQGALALRLRKRFRSTEPAQVVTVRDLAPAGSLDYELTGVGLVDIDTDTTLEGVYLELLDGGTLVAGVPVDVNGEFYLQGTQNNATLSFYSGDYRRTIELTRRGVARPDGR